jgi:hypothetical protein
LFKEKRKLASLKKNIWILPFILGLVSCNPISQNKQLSLSFYHWKAKFQPSSIEMAYLKELEVRKLYLRYFDVDLEEGKAVPISRIQFPTIPLQNRILVPVVFITNRCMRSISEEGAASLAEKIWLLIRELHPGERAPEEVQLDCDWSDSSRATYFALLRAMKRKVSRVSCTIRLHQIKHRERTGVPPVEKGVLMFYNMGDVQDIATANSILSLETARPYLERLSSYPLSLDLALPLFSWGVLFRDGQMIKLINQLERKELQNDSLASSLDGHYYRINRKSVLRGHFLYEGDTIRLENSPPEVLKRSMNLLSSQAQNKFSELIFYHLDSSLLKPYSYEFLRGLGQTGGSTAH